MGIPGTKPRQAPQHHRPPVPSHPLLLVKMASAQPQVKTEPTSDAQNIITALGKAFKGQNGAPLTGDQLALWLHQNMAQLSVLVKEGKLTQGQILAVRKPCQLPSPREFIPDLNSWPWSMCSSFVSLSLCDRQLTLVSCLSFHRPSLKSSPTNTRPPVQTPQTRRVPP